MPYHRTEVYVHVMRTGVPRESTWKSSIRGKKNDFVNGIY